MEHSMLYVLSLFSVLSDDEKEAIIALIDSFLSEQQSFAAHLE